MKLSQTLDEVKRCSDDMNARYGTPVFNEWAIVSLQPGHERLVAYQGPRRETFQKNFATDLGTLRSEILTKRHQPGFFDFARHAVGTGFEAFVCLGTELYLLCSNTQSSMNEIAKEPRWLDAQKAFVELTERFQTDPLAM